VIASGFYPRRSRKRATCDTAKWREAFCGADAEGYQGRNEGAHAVAGGQSSIGVAWNDLDEDDDPTIGLKSGKAKSSRETGGFLPWTEDDMALYRATWRSAPKRG
jgi:hypothetical protein